MAKDEYPKYEKITPTMRRRIELRPSKYQPGETYERPFIEVKCCGRWLSCEGFTTTCPRCEADYNASGSRLAPRDQWGEETGEHPADIARIR